ncbi:MAG: hypothetical protein AVDCRST_MAG18-2735 [uncultured Thermomicrobiales bacterium]|uniref:Uncharacterized protein n=1 Tax=uncultured Thermomicrobiales bacterium TaxID=1645740 RepID=A0A6J4VJE2_9BACT|nr:MAG: hypothetical protein AVDCRST_MAG18-2735 [uncultured Thermomicrobiales bacterium]
MMEEAISAGECDILSGGDDVAAGPSGAPSQQSRASAGVASLG